MAIDDHETISSMEQVTVRRQGRPKRHFTITSNVVLFGYRDLNDAEKLTYLAVQSFDWADGEGERKGYAFPSVETLAQLRNVDRRTIFRHLEKLEKCGLLHREMRAGRPALLHLQGPSEQETTAYLSTLGSDTDVTRDTDVTPTRDTDVTPYKQTNLLETDKHVNEFESVLQERNFEVTAGGWKKYQPKMKLTREQRLKRDYIAGEILKVTKDPHSLGFYRKVATTAPEAAVFAALSAARSARGITVLKSRGAFFTGIVAKATKGGEALDGTNNG